MRPEELRDWKQHKKIKNLLGKKVSETVLEGFGPGQFWEEATQNKRMIWTAFGKKGLKQITW